MSSSFQVSINQNVLSKVQTNQNNNKAKIHRFVLLTLHFAAAAFLREGSSWGLAKSVRVKENRFHINVSRRAPQGSYVSRKID